MKFFFSVVFSKTIFPTPALALALSFFSLGFFFGGEGGSWKRRLGEWGGT